jgi:hypothetical protein
MNRSAGTNYVLSDIIVFGASLVMSICVGINQFFNPNGRWKVIRSAHESLLSIIWKFRARVDMFELDAANSKDLSGTFQSAIDSVRA